MWYLVSVAVVFQWISLYLWYKLGYKNGYNLGLLDARMVDGHTRLH